MMWPLVEMRTSPTKMKMEQGMTLDVSSLADPVLTVSSDMKQKWKLSTKAQECSWERRAALPEI